MNPAPFPAARSASPRPDATRRRRWPTWLVVALALSMLALVMSASLLFGLAGLLQDGVGVTINGESWTIPSQDLHQLPALMAGAGVLAVLLMLMVAVPLLVVAAVVLAILLAAGLAVAGVALGIGGALFAVLATAALALSPLWLLFLLLWWALRRKPAPAAAPGTTMST
jgi:hypothetical protein